MLKSRELESEIWARRSRESKSESLERSELESESDILPRTPQPWSKRFSNIRFNDASLVRGVFT